jgi:hypothetical protein
MKRIVIAGAAVLGLLACSASSSSGDGFVGFATNGGATTGGSMCTEDAGVLTPIGPQGCGAGQTVVYRPNLLPGSGASGITSAPGAAASGGIPTPGAGQALPAMVTACTAITCGPGQVAVVTFQPLIGGSTGTPSTDGSALGDATEASEDGAASVVDGGTAPATDGAAPAPDSAAPGADAAPLATTDASADVATASPGDAGIIGIPCNAVVRCIDPPPTCPQGQSPSYAPTGQWHCVPLCNPNDSSMVVITYGASYGNVRVCVGAPPTAACPTQGQVWTWDYQNEEWACADECDNGQYDQHAYGGQTICVPC